MAKLYFRYGAMGSSKTANAIMVRHNYLERGQRVLMLKPRLDNRDGETMIASRSGLSCQCHFVEDLDRFNVREVYINYVGPVIGAHSGPGTLALFYVGVER